MRISNMLLPTLREAPSDAESISQRLMLRAGLIRKLSSGVYSYLPLGFKVAQNIEEIVREEMIKQGGQEVCVPSLVPMELYSEREEAKKEEAELFNVKDRSGREFYLAPGYEEELIEVIRNDVRSYKALPLTVFQIQQRFRDERRPRFGLLRGKAFNIMESCSFDLDSKGLDSTYSRMLKAFKNIFAGLGVESSLVEAGVDSEGNCISHDFIIESELGESEVACCPSFEYRADVSMAPCVPETAEDEEMIEIEKVFTPHAKTIEELISFLNISSKKMAKTLIYIIDKKVAAVMVRGDREVNETKLANILNASSIEMASSEVVQNATRAEVGFAGPVGINSDLLIIDKEVAAMKNFVIGANETEYHLKNVNYNRDFKADIIADIRCITDRDVCPKCKGRISIERGIKVGGVSKVGTRYLKAMGVNFIDETGNEKPHFVGSYRIGIDRTAAAIIEKNHDDKGIIWPMAVAPYQVIVVPVIVTNAEQMKLAEEIYNRLRQMNLDVLIDDRNERAGVKFKDADLIGIPIRVTVGKRAGEGIVEYKLRTQESPEDVKVEDIYEKVLGEVKKASMNIN